MAKKRFIYLLTGFMMNMILGVLYAWSIFVLPLENSFGWNRTQTSFTFTLILMFFSLGAILSGILLPRLKPTLIAALGGLTAGSGFFLSSFTTSLSGLYLGYGVMGGLGIGLAYVVPLAVTMRWFPDKKGLTSGLLTMGMAFGTFFVGSLGAHYLLGFLDWPVVFRIMGLTVAAVVMIGGLIMKLPADDFVPAGYSAASQGLWGFTLKQAAGSRAFILLLLWVFLIQTGGLMVMGHIVPLVKEMNLTPGQAAAALGIMALANGGGRFFFGFMLDKAGRRLSMTLTCLFMIAGLLALNHLPASLLFPSLSAAIILIGMSYGGSISQLVTLIAGFFGPRYFAVIFGVSTTCTIAASLAGPPLGGYIKDSFMNYDYAIYLAAVLALAGIAVCLLLRQPPEQT